MTINILHAMVYNNSEKGVQNEDWKSTEENKSKTQ